MPRPYISTAWRSMLRPYGLVETEGVDFVAEAGELLLLGEEGREDNWIQGGGVGGEMVTGGGDEELKLFLVFFG